MASDQVLATTVFVGVDTSNPDASTVECFRNPKNHLRGAVSVLNVAKDRANWNPDRSNEATVEQYLREIARFPGFKLEDSGRFRARIEAADWNTYLPKLVDSMVSDNASADRRPILERLQGLADVISSSERDFSSPLLFIQLLKRDNDSNNVSFSLYSAKLALAFPTPGSIQVTNTETNGSRSIYRVDGSYLSADAQRLAQWMSATTVEQWRQANTTTGKRGR